MRVKFWGSRGSIPAPIASAQVEQKILTALMGADGIDLKDRRAVEEYVAGLPPLVRGTTGGNTSCVSIQVGDEWIIVDAGSGLRPLGDEMMKGEFQHGRGVAHILLSHTHWDHIQGFPFFAPALVSGNRVIIYSPVHDVEKRLRGQQAKEYFPITLDYMRADISFVQLQEKVPITVAGVQVNNILQAHPGRSYSFRLDGDGASIVFASDAEYKSLGEANTQRYVDFMRNADLLIFDAQYTLSESFERPDWGHSSSMIGVDMAVRANVKRLILFHFAPGYTDRQVQEILDRTLNYASSDPTNPGCEVYLAIEGLELEVGRRGRTTLSHRHVGEAAVLTISGRFDASAVDQVNERLTALVSDRPRASIVVDMSQVTHLSIAGLKTLLTAQQMGQGVHLVLAAAPQNVQDVLAQVGFAEAFIQYETVQDAISALEARQYLQLEGQTLYGRYLIQGQIYLGRKAAAFKAFDTWLQRPVAVKVLSRSMGDEADQILLREARAVARLNHPNIVSVYNCVEYRDRLYLVREFVEGLNLRDRLDQLEDGQLLPPSQVLAIGEGILTALAYVHERGILHRYLHPRNIILSNHELKIMNFGLVDTPEEDWSLSDASYMAPEQLAKEQPTERADLYAFGVILYELVTGRMPFSADTVKQLIRLRMYHDPVPVRELNPNVPKSLEQIILNLLSQSPGHRYPSAAMVLDALRQVETWASRALQKDHKEAV